MFRYDTVEVENGFVKPDSQMKCFQGLYLEAIIDNGRRRCRNVAYFTVFYGVYKISRPFEVVAIQINHNLLH